MQREADALPRELAVQEGPEFRHTSQTKTRLKLLLGKAQRCGKVSEDIVSRVHNILEMTASRSSAPKNPKSAARVQEEVYKLVDIFCSLPSDPNQAQRSMLAAQLERLFEDVERMDDDKDDKEYLRLELSDCDAVVRMWICEGLSWQDVHDTEVSLLEEGGFAPRNTEVVRWDEDVSKPTQTPSEEISKIGGECGGGTAEGMGAAVGKGSMEEQSQTTPSPAPSPTPVQSDIVGSWRELPTQVLCDQKVELQSEDWGGGLKAKGGERAMCSTESIVRHVNPEEGEDKGQEVKRGLARQVSCDRETEMWEAEGVRGGPMWVGSSIHSPKVLDRGSWSALLNRGGGIWPFSTRLEESEFAKHIPLTDTGQPRSSGRSMTRARRPQPEAPAE